MDPRSIVYITAEVVVGLVSVVGNAVVLAAIIRTRQLHTVTNVFVGNLAAADIAVGLLVAPCAALSYKGLPRDFYGCVLINSVILLFTNVSILMLLAVALERFLAIKEPYVYQRLMTVRRAVLINMAVWLLGTLLGLVPMFGWNSGKHDIESCQFTLVISYEYMVYFQFFGLVLLPLFLMLCIYTYILVIVRRHLRLTAALHRQFLHNHGGSSSNKRNGSSNGRRGGKDGGDSRESTKTFNKDVRAAKMFALVILMFGLFWLPINIFNCVSLFCGPSCPFPIESLLAAIVMSHANSSINPFVYAARNTRIKRAIKRLFGADGGQDDVLSTDINNPGGYRSTNDVTAQREQSEVRRQSSAILVNNNANHHGTVRNYDSIARAASGNCRIHAIDEEVVETQQHESQTPTVKDFIREGEEDEARGADSVQQSPSPPAGIPPRLDSAASCLSSHEDIHAMVDACPDPYHGDGGDVYELQVYGTGHVTGPHISQENHENDENKVFFRRTFSPPQQFPLLSFPISTSETPEDLWPGSYHLNNTGRSRVEESFEHCAFLKSAKHPKDLSTVPPSPRRNTLPILRPTYIDICEDARKSFQSLKTVSNSYRCNPHSEPQDMNHLTGHTNPAFKCDSEVDFNDDDHIAGSGEHEKQEVDEDTDFNHSQSHQTSNQYSNHSYPSLTTCRHFLNGTASRVQLDEANTPPLLKQAPHISSASETNSGSEVHDSNRIFHVPTVKHVIPVKMINSFSSHASLRSPPLSIEVEESGLLRSKWTEHTKL